MADRKPLDEACTGGIFCPVAKHVISTPYRGNKFRIYHVKLTAGQYKTLRERRSSAPASLGETK